MNLFKMLFLEIKMDVLRTTRYRFSLITDILVYFVLFTVFMITDSGVSYAETYGYANYKELLLIGYVAWIFAISAISDVANNLKGELNLGTFYKKLSSKYSMQALYFGLFLSGILIETVVIIIVSILSKVVYGISISFHPQYIIVLVIGTIGMYGMGLIVAGFGVFFKRIGSIVFLIQTGLLFVTNTVPTNESILRVTKIIPLTKCNEILKQIVTNQPYYFDLVKLIIISAIWLMFGSIVFQVMISNAKKKGNLLFY